MATRLYSANPGDHLEDVVEAAGSAITTKNVELTVNLATTVVNDNGSTRAIQKEEVLICLNLFEQYIARGNWLPA